MPRLRTIEPTAGMPAGLMGWADALGEALGRGVARGLNHALANNLPAATWGPRKRGRPAKPVVGYVSADRRCATPGCGRPARAKGLCSAHYQAARRRKLARA